MRSFLSKLLILSLLWLPSNLAAQAVLLGKAAAIGEVTVVSGAGGGGGATWSLVQQVGSQFISCTPTCSGITVSSTGAGNLLFISATNENGGARFVSSASGGGTWVMPSGCQVNDNSIGAISCGYVLSSTGGVTTITPTVGVSDTYYFYVWEVKKSSGAITLDAINSTDNGTASSTPAGQALTLTGSADEIIQQIMATSGTISAISGGYGNQANARGFEAVADKETTSSGTAPTWTNSSSTVFLVSGVAFK